jgi:hypothetical protein
MHGKILKMCCQALWCRVDLRELDDHRCSIPGCGALELSDVMPQTYAGALRRLSEFENECLQAAPGALQAKALINVLKARIRDGGPSSFGAEISDALLLTFGVDASRWVTSRAEVEMASGFRGPRRWSESGGTVLAAACVSLGLDFNGARELVRTALEEQSLAPRRNRGNIISMRLPDCSAAGLRECKRTLTAYVQEHPDTGWGLLRHLRPIEFWTVVLKDPNWIQTILPVPKSGQRRRPIPSLSQDRQLILKRGEGLRAGRLIYDARVRARIRDHNWFALATEQLKERRLKATARRRDLEQPAFMEQVRLARVEWDRRPGRPRRFHVVALALYLGMSASSARERLVRFGLSVEEVIESKQQVVRRQISWAIVERLKAGKRLGVAAIMHEAKVPRNHPWVGEMTRELIANSNELWPLESIKKTGNGTSHA